MTPLQLFARLGLALAIGLLIGIERGWQLRDEKEGMRAAGIRTYALIGLLGGIWAALSNYVGGIVLGFAAASFAACFALFAWGEERALNANSATGMIAAFLAFALGALSVFGPAQIAAGGAVAATLLLAERTALHAFVSELKWSELRAALILLVMTVILLPILPDRTMDPWGALNPYELWLMTVSIAALSYAGYVFVRLLGRLRGLFFGAAAAALVSSTAVTLNYSRLVREEPAAADGLAAGILAAWSISLLRMTAIAVFLAPALFATMAPPIAAGAVVFAAAALFFYWRAEEEKEQAEIPLKEPFDLGLVLRFGLLLTFIMLAYKLTTANFGAAGARPLAAIAGFADVDPITLSVAQSARKGTNLDAATQILLAATTNLGTRAAIVAWTRNGRFVLPLLAIGVIGATALWATFWFFG